MCLKGYAVGTRKHPHVGQIQAVPPDTSRKETMKIQTDTHNFNDHAHVLIVGEDSKVVANLRDILEQHNYEVSTASKGSDMFRPILDEVPNVVILDPQVSEQQISEAPGDTENLHLPTGEMPLPETGQAREMLKGDYNNIIGESAETIDVLHSIEIFASSPTTVLISGETGTGKELVAHSLHENSSRSKQEMIILNCAEISEQLMESQLFGHEKGAFTGADRQHKGLFEMANGSTLFLDEIGELPIYLQPKLLRVLQEGEIRRVGGTARIPVDVRVVVATNRDLTQDVKNGKFRQDVYQRLKTLEISVPALRERRVDIPALTQHFLKTESQYQGQKMRSISTRAIALLHDYNWPGNIRELKGIITRALLMTQGDMILPEHLPPEFHETHVRLSQVPEDGAECQEHPIMSFPIGLTLKEIERKVILMTFGWQNEHRSKTAEILGISARTLRSKLRDYRFKR